MRLLVKFSAIFTLVFGIGVAIIGALTYRMLEDGAHAQVLAQIASHAANGGTPELEMCPDSVRVVGYPSVTNADRRMSEVYGPQPRMIATGIRGRP